MEPAWHAALAGMGAGLAIAVPLGAIGVLIIQQGLTRGWQAAWPAAAGVALVDFGYATLATVAGAGVTGVLTGRTRTVQLVGAAVLVSVAVHGLFALRHSRSVTSTPVDAPTDTAGLDAVRSGRVLRRFVALTAINPLTAVYFVVLAAGLGRTVAGWRAGSAFVLGVLGGSLAWQLVLASAGSFAGARLPAGARTVTGVVGYLMVAGYAVHLAVG